MKRLYLDTNIFIYLSDKKSPYFQVCSNLITHCQNHDIQLSTSVETIQEIVHYAKNTKQLPTGLTVAKNTLELVDTIFDVTRTTIELYLQKAQVYQNVKSRDILHVSTCLENKIDKIVTLDKEFSAFKEIKAVQPSDIVK